MHATVADDEVGQVPFLVEREPLRPEPLPETLEEREPGAVRGVDRPGESRPPERAAGERSVRCAAEDRAKMFHLDDGRSCLAAEEFDRVLVAEVVGTLHRVVDVGVDRILLPEGGVDAALRRARVRAQRVEFGDHRDVPASVDRGERGPLAREPRPHDHDLVPLHVRGSRRAGELNACRRASVRVAASEPGKRRHHLPGGSSVARA